MVGWQYSTDNSIEDKSLCSKLRSESKLNIFKIKPGISGLAQISGYDMSDPKKLAKVDKIYVDNSDWILDLKIILATIFPPLRESIKTKFINDI